MTTATMKKANPGTGLNILRLLRQTSRGSGSGSELSGIPDAFAVCSSIVELCSEVPEQSGDKRHFYLLKD